MNTAMIEDAARQIRELSDGLEWLRSNANHALCPSDRDSFSVVVALNSCSALPGAKSAARMLGSQARLLGQTLANNAITDAVNTIEILRQKISTEIEKG